MIKKVRDYVKFLSKLIVELIMEMEISCILDMMEDNGQEVKISCKVNNFSQVIEFGGIVVINFD